jgi:hypothetical protein
VRNSDRFLKKPQEFLLPLTVRLSLNGGELAVTQE